MTDDAQVFDAASTDAASTDAAFTDAAFTDAASADVDPTDLDPSDFDSSDIDDPQPDTPEMEATGDPRVDAAVSVLSDLDGRPAAEHVAVYDDAHRRLQDALADLDA